MNRPLVVLCGDGLPADWPLAALAPSADVVTVAGLCEHPGRLAAFEPAGRPLVVGLCSGAPALGGLHREAQRAAVDPIGIEVVRLDESGGDSGRLAVMLTGAVARAVAYPGSDTRNVKVIFPNAVTRRALLVFSMPEYLATPAIDDETCASARGCRACIDVCPQSALSLGRGRVVHDREACEPCGRCVTACPTGAMVNPAVTAAAIEAQVRAIADTRVGTPGPRGVVFRCARAAVAETTPGWYPVTVPCGGMVTESWLLAPLVLGISAVALQPCAAIGCPLGNDRLEVERATWCAELLAASGGASDRITMSPGAPPTRAPLPQADLADPFAPGAAGDVVLAVVERAGGAGPVIHPGGSLGQVEIDAAACTGCATCAESCPTSALVVGAEPAATVISFDARRCVACGTCVARCPEAASHAIRLAVAVDTDRLRAGPVPLWRGEVARCQVCGSAIAASALLARFASQLDDDRLLERLSSRCSDCRSAW